MPHYLQIEKQLLQQQMRWWQWCFATQQPHCRRVEQQTYVCMSPGVHCWSYNPGTLSCSQVYATHWKLCSGSSMCVWCVSLHLASSTNEFSWCGKFTNSESIVADLLYNLCEKLNVSALMPSSYFYHKLHIRIRCVACIFKNRISRKLISGACQVLWNTPQIFR